MLGRTDSRTRMMVIMLAFALVATAAAARLGQWQIVEAGDLAAQYDAVMLKRKEAAAAARTVRADIVDRDGRILARTTTFDQVVAYPDTIDADEVDEVALTVASILDLKPREERQLQDSLAAAQANGEFFISLVPAVTLDQSEMLFDAIEDDLLPGIGLEPKPVRNYPRKGGQPGTSLGSQLLGFVRADGRGGDGLERYYHDRLLTADPSQVDVAALDGTPLLTGLDPTPLELTIDAKLQKQVEHELHTAYRTNKAKSASAIVMDPETGAILAAASIPSFHAEDYVDIFNADASVVRNRVFSDQYEPGSVMKIFTASAALDLGVVTPQTRIADEKKLEFWRYTVRNADHDSQGILSVKDVIAWSRNVATAKIARKLAPNPRASDATQKAAHRLFDFWDKVGLVGPTGVDISGEASGRSFDPDNSLWAPVDLANRAFGQGASFTLPQLARGVAVLVNGGFLVQPHLVADGQHTAVEPERVVRAKTARQAKDIMRHVTGSLPWYAEGSLIPGYDVGGKTGTAQIWDVKKQDWKKRFNHSFIGFIGGKNQEYVIAVRLEEPKPSGKVEQGVIPLKIESYELYQMVARATIKHMGMKKSKRPDAGLPIVGTLAAERLTPVRNREVKQAQKQQVRQEAKQTAKRAEQAKRKADDPALAAEPKASGGGET